MSSSNIIHQQQQQHQCPNNNNNNNISNGPCGACKYLRRKCVKGCVFAPYFDSEQGTSHFAAVHKVFGASNAAKLLLRVPLHKRLDTMVTLCFQALSRLRDPVYGCVSHIFSLQQQVLNLQTELAYVQARLSTLQRLPPNIPMGDNNPPPPQITSFPTTSHMTTTSTPSLLDDMLHSQPMSSPLASELASFYNLTDYQLHDDMSLEDGDLHTLTREFVSKYLPGVKFKPEPH